MRGFFTHLFGEVCCGGIPGIPPKFGAILVGVMLRWNGGFDIPRCCNVMLPIPEKHAEVQ